MTAYNRLNGTHLSQSTFLTSILRGPSLPGSASPASWNSSATILSDWFGTYSVSESINAGLDLEMPGEQKWRMHYLVNRALFSKQVTVRTVKERARKVVELVRKCCEGAPEVGCGVSFLSIFRFLVLEEELMGDDRLLIWMMTKNVHAIAKKIKR
jgi:beta-glucosidase